MSKPVELVPDRETCERMKALGFPQDCCFNWLGYDDNEPDCYHVVEADAYVGPAILCAAPTLQEVLREFGGIVGAWQVFLAYRMQEETEFSDALIIKWHREFLESIQDAQAVALLWIKLREEDETLLLDEEKRLEQRPF